MENKLSLKDVIKNAKHSALRDGYDYFIIHDSSDDTYSFVRDYGQSKSDNSIIGKVISQWKSCLITVKYVKY